MNRLAVAALIAASLFFGSMSAYADPITIEVKTAVAPNGFGSDDYPAWQSNAVNALMNGAASWGAAGSPSHYFEESVVTSAEVIVTGFPSWRGQVDPGTLGPAFANEYGNRMMFPVAIYGNGTQFSISQLGFVGESTDPFNALNFAFGPGSYNYSAGYVGVLYGADNALGGGDDTLITAGANTQLVDALFGRGSGNSFAAYCSGCTLDEQRDALRDVAGYPGSLFYFTGTYTLAGTDAAGSATFDIQPVPEPGTLALLGGGLAMIAIRRRRSRQI